MANWVLKGLRTGIRATPYPRRPTTNRWHFTRPAAGTASSSADRAEELAQRRPTGASALQNSGVAIDQGRVHRYRACPRRWR